MDDFRALIEALSLCQGSFVLSNYPQDFIPPSDWQCIEIEITSSASGKGKVNSDRSKMSTQSELGERERTEVLWWVDRSGSARPDVARIMRQLQWPSDAGEIKGVLNGKRIEQLDLLAAF